MGVWNRITGVLDLFFINPTHTGSAPWVYPGFKGYFSEVVWTELSTLEGRFTIASPDKDLFVRLFDFYAVSAQKRHPELPAGDISFLDRIPATGSKMGLSNAQVRGRGPSSALNTLDSPVKRTLYFYFGAPEPPEKKAYKLPAQNRNAK